MTVLALEFPPVSQKKNTLGSSGTQQYIDQRNYGASLARARRHYQKELAVRGVDRLGHTSDRFNLIWTTRDL